LDVYNKYLYLLESVQLPGVLNRLDTTTMAASVLGRVPYTDPDLIEVANQIPWKYKLHWNSPFYESMCARLNAFEIAETMDTAKYILKRSFVDKVPPDITFRKKCSFPVPLNSWMDNGIMTGVIESALDGCPDFLNREGVLHWMFGIDDTNKDLKIWMLLNLMLWYDEYFNKSEYRPEIKIESIIVSIY